MKNLVPHSYHIINIAIEIVMEFDTENWLHLQQNILIFSGNNLNSMWKIKNI